MNAAVTRTNDLINRDKQPRVICFRIGMNVPLNNTTLI